MKHGSPAWREPRYVNPPLKPVQQFVVRFRHPTRALFDRLKEAHGIVAGCERFTHSDLLARALRFYARETAKATHRDQMISVCVRAGVPAAGRPLTAEEAATLDAAVKAEARA